MKTCGATPGGPSLDGIDLSEQTVIQGIIFRDGSSDSVPNGTAVANGYVRLLDSSGEFTAEVPTNAEGQFRFFAEPGTWVVVVQVPGARSETTIQAQRGVVTDLVLHI